MALSKERLGELALSVLEEKMEKDGVTLNPGETKREIHNQAKRLGVPEDEVAELAKIVYSAIYGKTMMELQKIIAAKVEA